MYSSTLKMLCLPSVPNQEPEKNTINISGVFLSAGSFCAFLATNSVIRPRQCASLFASCISRNAFTDTHSRRRVGWGGGSYSSHGWRINLLPCFILFVYVKKKAIYFICLLVQIYALPPTFMHFDAILIHVSMKTFGDLKKMDMFIIY